MTYIEKLVSRKFRDGEEVKVDAKELQRLACCALRNQLEVERLRFENESLKLRLDTSTNLEKMRIYA